MKKWTKEKMLQEVKKYKTQKELRKNNMALKSAIERNGIRDEAYAHMDKLSRKWSNEELKEEALKYKYMDDFYKESSSAYIISRNRGIFKHITSHLDNKLKRWTDDNTKEEALKYDTRTEFARNSACAWQYAIRNDILEEICSHMQILKKGFDFNAPAILYYLKINDGQGYKIGITNREVKERFFGEMKKIEILKTWAFNKGRDAKKREQEILLKFKEYQYKGKDLLYNANSEIFSKDVLEID